MHISAETKQALILAGYSEYDLKKKKTEEKESVNEPLLQDSP